MSEILLTAFVGGVFGASLGALWAFCLCGLATMLGCVLVLSGGSDFLLLQVGLGPIFGPHAGGFLSGVIAASYASARGKHPGGSGKDILSPLMGTSWDVLAVGGAAAAAGALLASAIGQVPILREFDHLGLAIIVATFIGRGLFHREGPFGKKDSIAKHGLLGTDNYALSWVGWMSPPPLLLMIGAGAGGLSGSVAKMAVDALAPLAASGAVSPAAAGAVPVIFGWAFSAVMLTCLQFGQGSTQKTPVTHCMALLGALTYLYTGSLIGAVIGGIFGAFLQELCARLFVNHASDHLDPPAAGIAFGTLILNVIFKPGLLGLSALF
ncbi:MAG: hypothetical protein LBJ64_11720 [Deltaproteobacteria bacterium]|jgi:hypothetical protein|nr:hypothetical protein [Deltaproteobacteria bacterium]